MKIAIFTRTGHHHTCFINRLQEAFRIACVIREAYPENPATYDSRLSSEDRACLEKFYSKYSAGFTYHAGLKDYLKSTFEYVIKKKGTQYLDIECGGINSREFAVFLEAMKPDIAAVLGSSVIGPHIIGIPSTAMINLHSGLSPYYRGTWSYGWPIVNNEPEYIGATVHHVNPGIDTGDIICQTKPVLNEGDDLNSIFLKVISEGFELVVKTLKRMVNGDMPESFRQPASAGRHYRTQDLTAAAANTCLRNLENGIIGKYNSDKEQRDAVVRLYGYVPPSVFV